MKMNAKKSVFLIMMICVVFLVNPYPLTASASSKKKQKTVLQADDFKHYADYFNRMEGENIAKAIPNSVSWDWMKANIPLFECPQDNFQEIYYYRWWSLQIGRAHV